MLLTNMSDNAFIACVAGGFKGWVPLPAPQPQPLKSPAMQANAFTVTNLH